MKNLAILKLDQNDISDIGVAFLTQLVNLQNLSLYACSNIGPSGAGHLAQLKNLQILNLSI